MDHLPDQNELLELIDGELSEEQSGHLLEQLAGDPETAEMVGRLIADRLALRSLPEPPLPRSFIDDLEPMLARPMLIETQPGAYRRRQHRPRRRRQVVLMATAAMVMIAAGAALITSLPGLLGRWAGPVVVKSDPAPSSTSVAPPPAVLPTNDGGDAESRHPLTSEGVAAATSRDPAAPPSLAAALLSSGESPLLLPFAVVVIGPAPEAAAGEVVDSMTDGGALVRNFSYDQARLLEEQWFLTRRPKSESGGAPVSASVPADGVPARERWRAMADRVRQQLRGRRESAPPAGLDPAAGEQVAGRAKVRPSFEQQLQCSERGADHTIAVPAAALNEVLARLDRLPGVTTRLEMLESVEGGRRVTDPASTRWDAQWTSIARLAHELATEHPEVTVVLPVVGLEP